MSSPNDVGESSFPLICSVGEVPSIMDKSSCLGMSLDESREKVYIISSENNSCHVVTYSYASSSSPCLLQKTSFSFDKPVCTAELYRREDKVRAVVVTGDGRLWDGAMDYIEKGMFSYIDIFTEVSLEQRLMDINFLSVCQDCKDGPAVVAVGRSAPSPPRVMWLDDGGTELNIISKHVPGLEHIHAPITSVLFLSRNDTSSAFWSLLMTEQSSDQSIESILLLGFSDGAIRLCLITNSKVMHPVRLLVRIDSTKQQVVSILAMTSGSQSLVDAICAVGRNGAVSTLDESGRFQHILGGLSLTGPWKSAVMIECTEKKTILALRQDGSSHLLVIADKDSTGKVSLCMPLPIRNDMATVNSCMMSGGAWVSLGTLEGSVILMHVDSNIQQKLLAWEGSNDRSSGILDVVGEQSDTDSLANPTHSLLQRLSRYDRMDKDASTNASELALELDADLLHAMDTTEFVMKVARGNPNDNDGSSKNVPVTVFEKDGTVTVKANSLKGTPPLLGERTWTSSLHSCFGTQGGDESKHVFQRRLGANESWLPVHYGNVAVADCRAMADGADVEQRIEWKKDGVTTVDAFISVTDRRELNDKQEDDGVVQAKRRKTEPTDASSEALTLVIPL